MLRNEVTVVGLKPNSLKNRLNEKQTKPPVNMIRSTVKTLNRKWGRKMKSKPPVQAESRSSFFTTSIKKTFSVERNKTLKKWWRKKRKAIKSTSIWNLQRNKPGNDKQNYRKQWRDKPIGKCDRYCWNFRSLQK